MIDRARLRWLLTAVCSVMVAGLIGTVVSAGERTSRRVPVYVASYSADKGAGIFVAEFSEEDGTFSDWQSTGGVQSPASIAIHPDGSHLYATITTPDPGGAPVGFVAGFRIDPATHQLSPETPRQSGGTGPCWVEVVPDGRCLLVANCGTATVACLSLLPDGRIGESATVVRHEGQSQNSEGKPQAHSIIAAPGGRFAIAADLGLDRLFVYRLNSGDAILQSHVPPYLDLKRGAGPRHLTRHPGGRYLYSINELGNTITALSFNSESGQLERLGDVSSLPADFAGESYAADIQVHSNGQWLFGTNRLHDSLVMCRIDESSGLLNIQGHIPSGGKFPRSIALSPAGRFLIAANQKSDQLAVFRINVDTGRLEPTGHTSEIPQPVCIRFAPTGK